jgi:biotin synthase
MNCSKPVIRNSRGGLRLVRRSFSSVQDVPSYAPTVLQKALAATEPRTDWLKDEISQIYNAPLFELHYAAVRHPSFNGV